MVVDLTPEEMDYIIDLVKGGNPGPLQRSVAIKLAFAFLDAPNEEFIKHAQETAAPDPD